MASESANNVPTDTDSTTVIVSRNAQFGPYLGGDCINARFAYDTARRLLFENIGSLSADKFDRWCYDLPQLIKPNDAERPASNVRFYRLILKGRMTA